MVSSSDTDHTKPVRERGRLNDKFSITRSTCEELEIYDVFPWQRIRRKTKEDSLRLYPSDSSPVIDMRVDLLIRKFLFLDYRQIHVSSNQPELIQKTVVEFDLPFLINLPDDCFPIKHDNFSSVIELKRIAVTSPGKGLPRGVGFPTDAHILGDRWGRLAYSRVKVTFKHNILLKFHILIDNYIIPKCIELVQRILQVCRAVSGDHYVHNVTRADIMSYEMTHYDEHDIKIPGDLIALLGGGGTLTMGGADEVNADNLDTIKEMLKNDTRLPLEQELLLNANDYHFYGNYKVAVIEAETAFETFVYQFISKHYRSLGKPESYIEKLYEASFKNLLKDHIKKITGSNFYSSTQYSNWQLNTYQLRNKIVHQGKTEVSADESHRAILTVDGTIKYIDSLII